jgi:hypothetical protein
VLRLDLEATEHLHELAHPRPGRRRTAGESDRISPPVLRLVEALDVPAFVLNRRMDVLVRNRLSASLCGWLEHSDNVMRMTFLNPLAAEFFPDWERDASGFVAHMRAMLGAGRDEPFLLELVEELSRGSDDFCRMWARHDVRSMTNEIRRMRHHDVGDLTLLCETLGVGNALGQVLVTFQPEPGSTSERALTRLAASLPPGQDSPANRVRRAG